MMARVLIADDHALYRAGIGQMLSSEPGYVVVGESASAEATVRLASNLQPDLITLDVELDGNPIERTLRKLRRAAPHSKTVVLTMHNDRLLRDQVLALGAACFVSKSSPTTDILAAFARALRFDAAAVLQRKREILSPREGEVIRLLSRALSNKEIAAALSISEGTVKRHTGNIYEKLEARSRMDAVARAKLLGIL